MTVLPPPRLATWLLNQFGCAADNDAVIGDLAERYRQGKTLPWYWKQVLTTIVVSAFNEIREHKFLTLRAVFVGWGFFSYVLLPLVGVVLKYLLSEFTAFGYQSENVLAASAAFHALIAFEIFLVSVMGLLTGWLVARVYPRRRSAILLTAMTVPTSVLSGNYDESLAFWLGIAALTCGILVGGLRRHGAAASPPPRLYWRQVAVTIAVGAFKDIRHHKLVTLRDLTIGFWVQSFALNMGFYYLGLASQRWAAPKIFPTVNSWASWWTYAEFTTFYDYTQAFSSSFVVLLAGVLSGWIVAKLDPDSRRSTHLAFCTALVFLWMAYGLTGVRFNFFQVIGAFLGGLLMRKPRLPLELA